MHLSIRPYPPPGEGDAIKKKKKRVPDGSSAASHSDVACLISGFPFFLQMLLATITPMRTTTRLHAADVLFAEHFMACREVSLIFSRINSVSTAGRIQ